MVAVVANTCKSIICENFKIDDRGGREKLDRDISGKAALN